jgi:hypothetical protein
MVAARLIAFRQNRAGIGLTLFRWAPYNTERPHPDDQACDSGVNGAGKLVRTFAPCAQVAPILRCMFLGSVTVHVSD